MTEATVSNQGQVWRGRCREGSSGGCSGVCEAVACVLSASRSRGEAHGANSCHGETLTPLNAQSGKHCRAGHMPVGESGWGMGEEGERGDAADAVEKGDSTPVKWLIKVQWSPIGGHGGERQREKFKTLFGKRSPVSATSLKTADTFIWCIYGTRDHCMHEMLLTDAFIFLTKAERHV